MRVPTWSVLILLSMPAAACGGDDLTLPGPGHPAALRIVAGDGQRGLLGEALSNPLVVRLVDVEGLPVEGRAVVFRFTDDVPDATIDPDSVPTDADGRAAVRARLGRRWGHRALRRSCRCRVRTFGSGSGSRRWRRMMETTTAAEAMKAGMGMGTARTRNLLR
jgi:hypothetical protein